MVSGSIHTNLYFFRGSTRTNNWSTRRERRHERKEERGGKETHNW
jgi:hypothetical protein